MERSPRPAGDAAPPESPVRVPLVAVEHSKHKKSVKGEDFALQEPTSNLRRPVDRTVDRTLYKLNLTPRHADVVK